LVVKSVNVILMHGQFSQLTNSIYIANDIRFGVSIWSFKYKTNHNKYWYYQL